MKLKQPIPDTPVGGTVNIAVKGALDEVCKHTHSEWVPCSIPRVPPAELVALVGAKCTHCQPVADREYPRYHPAHCPVCHGTGSPLVELQWECDTESVTCHCGCDGPCDNCNGGTTTADGLWRLTELLPVVVIPSPLELDAMLDVAERMADARYIGIMQVSGQLVLVESGRTEWGIAVVGTPEPGGYIARWERVT